MPGSGRLPSPHTRLRPPPLAPHRPVSPPAPRPRPAGGVSLCFRSRVARWRRRGAGPGCCCRRCCCCCRRWPPRCWARPPLRSWARYRAGPGRAGPGGSAGPSGDRRGCGGARLGGGGLCAATPARRQRPAAGGAPRGGREGRGSLTVPAVRPAGVKWDLMCPKNGRQVGGWGGYLCAVRRGVPCARPRRDGSVLPGDAVHWVHCSSSSCLCP